MRALLFLSCLLAAVPAQQSVPVTYSPPVTAPVTDPFRPPATPYGPGNRGLEYGTAPGVTVGGAAPGTVTFAGPVAGRSYVTILHADGLRTSYGPLRDLRVTTGGHVGRGDPVGTTTGPLLWTARIGDAYVDPAVLLAASGHTAVRLVPVPGSGRALETRRQPGAVSGCAAAWAFGRNPWGSAGSGC